MTQERKTASSSSPKSRGTMAPITIEQFDSSTRRNIPRQAWISPRQLKELRSGPKVNIVIGTAGNRFVAVESAHVNVLKMFSGLGRDSLSHAGVNNFVVDIDPICKDSIRWVYRYMMAGGTDADFDATERIASKDFPGLVGLYHAADKLQYERLANIVWNTIRGLILENSCWDVSMDSLKFLIHYLPETLEVIAESLVHYTSFSVTTKESIEEFKYIDEILEDEQIGKQVHAAMTAKLQGWEARSQWYYASMKPFKTFNEVLQLETRRAQLARRECFACGTPGHLGPDCTASVEVRKAHIAKIAKTKAIANKTVPSSGTREKSPTAAAQTMLKAASTTLTNLATPKAASASKANGKVAMNATAQPIRKSYAQIASSNSDAPANSQARMTGRVQLQPVSVGSKPTAQPAARKQVTNMKPVAPLSNLATPSMATPPIAMTVSKQATTSSKPNHTNASQKSGRQPPVCYNCDEPGHIARDCLWAPLKPKSVLKPPKCYHCGKLGHVARNCWSLAQNGHGGTTNNFFGGVGNYNKVVISSGQGTST